MSVKIRVSYQRPQELQTVLKLLNPLVKSCKVAKRQDGAYRKAYITLTWLDEENVKVC